jgi:hypothetical protein
MPKKASAPEAIPFSQVLVPMPKFNSATVINRPDTDPASKTPTYNCTTDDGLASRRDLHDCRSQAEYAAAYSGDLPLGQGLSLRMAMAGQAENDQFPYSTDEYGKQRS